MEIVIAALLLVIAVQLYSVLRYLKRIDKNLDSIESGLIGNGHGGLSKLSFLEHISQKFDELKK